MSATLLETLNGLKKDPTLVLILYKQLFDATFYALVRKGTETVINKTEFFTYESQDKVRELPLFTEDKFIFNDLSSDILIVKFTGQAFWKNLLNVIENGECEIAINPSQSHGIRLTKSIILGMIGSYGTR